MKIHILLITIIGLLTPAFLCANEKAEADLISLVRKIEASGNLTTLSEVYLSEDAPLSMSMSTHKNFEAIITRGIERIGFIDIYPMMKERASKPMTIEGKEYSINVDPYKMLEVVYSKKIEGGSSGFQVIVGEKEGRLWIAGLKEKK
jgi:hypothetical protein